MTHKLSDILEGLELHAEARHTGKRHIDMFKVMLFTEAKLIAHQRGDNVILRSDIEHALKITYEKRYQIGVQKQWAGAIGGACVGAFVPGFVTELFNQNDVLLIVFTSLGLIGVALLTWSFKR